MKNKLMIALFIAFIACLFYKTDVKACEIDKQGTNIQINLYNEEDSKNNGRAYSTDKDPFDNLRIFDDSVIENNARSTVKNITKSWYKLCMAIGAVGFILTGIGIGISLMLARTPAARQEIKARMGHKIVYILALFAFAYIVGLVLTFANYIGS